MATSVMGERSGNPTGNSFITRESLDPGLLGDLEAMGINRGTAFFSNSLTSMFTSDKGALSAGFDVVQNAAASAGSMLGTAGNVASNVLTMGTGAIVDTSKLINFSGVCAEKIINESTVILTTYATKIGLLLATYPVNLAKEIATKTAKKYAEGSKEILSQMLKSDELKDAESADKTMQDNIDKVKNSINDKISELTNSVNNTLGKIQEPLDKITSYAAEGPDFIIDKANKYIEDTLNIVNTYAYNIYNKTKEWTEKSIETKSDEISERKSKNKLEKLRVDNQDKLNELEAKKKEALAKASAAKMKALLKIKGLMGM